MTIAADRVRVDVTFPVTGPPVQRDHGHALFAAMNRVLGDLHGADWLAVHPLRGRLRPDGLLDLPQDQAHLRLRLPPQKIPEVVPLTGARMNILGCPLRLGPATIHQLHPVPALFARLVVLSGHIEEPPFIEAIRQRLEQLQVTADLRLGRRRVMHVGPRQIVGFGVELRQLADDASLLVQYQGLGGRQRLGCGSFVPLADSKGASH